MKYSYVQGIRKCSILPLATFFQKVSLCLFSSAESNVTLVPQVMSIIIFVEVILKHVHLTQESKCKSINARGKHNDPSRNFHYLKEHCIERSGIPESNLRNSKYHQSRSVRVIQLGILDIEFHELAYCFMGFREHYNCIELLWKVVFSYN